MNSIFLTPILDQHPPKQLTQSQILFVIESPNAYGLSSFFPMFNKNQTPENSEGLNNKNINSNTSILNNNIITPSPLSNCLNLAYNDDSISLSFIPLQTQTQAQTQAQIQNSNLSFNYIQNSNNTNNNNNSSVNNSCNNLNNNHYNNNHYNNNINNHHSNINNSKKILITNENENKISNCNISSSFSSQFLGKLQSHKTVTHQKPPIINPKSLAQNSKIRGLASKKNINVTDFSSNTNTQKKISSPSSLSTSHEFLCRFCSKSFTHSRNCLDHEYTHTGEKPFQCVTCERGFANRSNLNRHLRVHSGDRPYTCNICGKCFSQSGNLKVHRRTIHHVELQGRVTANVK